jgi:demethoxyubiquinone hydroxylase (CLK1/Coq7/Cat5 family)
MHPQSSDHKRQLIHVLRMAYSGEKAAAYAYNAHWRTVKRPEEIESIKKIEKDEWDHRAIVGDMLAKLGSEPQKWREVMMSVIGWCAGFACYVGGWFMPMYFAGRLESANIQEYAVAAHHAESLGLNEFAQELSRLSIVEAEHEQFFLRMVQGCWQLPFVRAIFKWGEVIAGTEQAVARY